MNLDAAGSPTAAQERQLPMKSRLWMLGFGLTWLGFWLLVMLPGQFMILKFASTLDPDSKVGVGSFMIAEMAIMIVLFVPIVGWLCDRSNPRFGRRRTWALGGFIVAAVPFAFVGAQTTWQVAALLLAVVAIGQSAVLVSLSAIIADQVPVEQRGRASAAMGVPQVIALALGMVIVTELITDVTWSWAIIGLLAVLSGLPFLLGFAEPALVVAPRDKQRHAISFRDYHDFGWAGISRVLVNAGNLVGTTYLLYFLGDGLGLDDPDSALTILILIYLVASGAASYVGGVITDRTRARRALVATSSGLQALAALTLAFVPTWPATIVAGVLLGIGYGTFLAVDQALLTDVLPNDATRARDLGIVNSAQNIPIASLLGWFVLSVAGYTELYIVAAIIMTLGAVAVYRIKSVR